MKDVPPTTAELLVEQFAPTVLLTLKQVAQVTGQPRYRARRQVAVASALEASPVACAVRELLETEASWRGPTKGLFDMLAMHREPSESWPRSPRGLADALRRAAPALRLLGVRVSFEPVRRRDGYHVALTRLPGDGNGGDHPVVGGRYKAPDRCSQRSRRSTGRRAGGAAVRLGV